jgi:hypothetical protein
MGVTSACRRMSSSYIGSRISLTTKSLIRYEGVLHNIDPASSMITVKDVTMFGTEGRRGGVQEVPRQPQVFASIDFVGNSIQELHILAMDAPESTEDVAAIDPAIASVERSEPAASASSDPASSSSYAPGTGDFAAHADYRGGHSKASKGGVVGEFDFESSNEKFDKKSEMAALASGEEDKTVYNPKSSFFDEMTTSTTDHSEEARRKRRDAQRKRNMETFGAEGLRVDYGSRRGGGHSDRGRGRGGHRDRPREGGWDEPASRGRGSWRGRGGSRRGRE